MALDLSLQWHQEELARTARDLLADYSTLEALTEAESGPMGFSSEAHRRMGDLGWLELGLPGGEAGVDADAVDMIVLYEELGRAAMPGPHFVCQLAARLLGHFDPGDDSGLVEDIVGGRRIASVALYEPLGDMTPVSTIAEEAVGGYLLSGAKSFVPYAAGADVILVLADTDAGPGFFIVEPGLPGVRVEVMPTLSGERQHSVELDRVQVDQAARLPGSAFGAVGAALPGARLAQAAELVGLAHAALEMAVEYAGNRVAFGHPIGSYQAIQHKCAEMVADRDAARYLTYQAACLLNDGMSADPRVTMAKAFASGAARRVTKEAHQIFGGAGYVLDHRLNFYYRRAKGIEMSLGGADELLDEIAGRLIDQV